MTHDRLKVFAGNANPGLTEQICRELGIEQSSAMVKQFSDGEIRLQLNENVRGVDVFVIQPTCQPVDRNIMELLLMLDALKRSSAQRITAVLPYYGYARQDRKDRPRVPISARLVAALLETAGASRVLTLDLHAAQIQGFFDIPVDHLFAMPVMIDYFKAQDIPDLTVVSPDDPDGMELSLEPDGHPAAGPFKKALVEDGIPFTSFAVDDLHAEYERLSAAGVRFTQPPVDMGPVKTAVLDDSCGNLIQLAQKL